MKTTSGVYLFLFVYFVGIDNCQHFCHCLGMFGCCPGMYDSDNSYYSDDDDDEDDDEGDDEILQSIARSFRKKYERKATEKGSGE